MYSRETGQGKMAKAQYNVYFVRKGACYPRVHFIRSHALLADNVYEDTKIVSSQNYFQGLIVLSHIQVAHLSSYNRRVQGIYYWY